MCAIDQVDLRGSWGSARFTVELADSPKEHAKGLMFRESMPQMAGMLFVFDPPEPLAFWMRNTLIPLDMLFVDAQGVVKRIHENAIPLDETLISGGKEKLVAVLEINGGMSDRLGITEGSVLRHPAMPQQSADWPCEVQ